jgi:hypothetical protein
MKRVVETDVDGVNKMLQLLSEINNKLYENNRLLEMDHKTIIQMAEDVRKIKINTRT